MSSTARGIALKLGSTFFFTLQYMAIKLAGAVPVGQVIFFRAFFALIPIGIVIMLTVGPRVALRTQKPLLHLGRSLIGLTGMYVNFWSVQLLPLADVTGYNFVQPIFAVILAAILLKEKVGLYRGGAVVLGFVGVLFMLEPHGGLAAIVGHGVSGGTLVALTSALITAFVIIFIRQMSASERAETIVFYFMCLCATFGAITLLFQHVPLTANQTAWLIASGIFGGFGQLGMTFCYRYAEPSLLAPFDYVAMVWAVTIGFFVFAEVPQTLVLVGSGIVIAAGIFIAWREHRIGRELASRAQSV